MLYEGINLIQSNQQRSAVRIYPTTEPVEQFTDRNPREGHFHAHSPTYLSKHPVIRSSQTAVYVSNPNRCSNLSRFLLKFVKHKFRDNRFTGARLTVNEQI